ncbi:uncharacterized protein LOC125456777 [Stegostoma tigrinum]|uniref:uncharacterized protein LOC125456777 n=1 Tax=Stegostoma tigrinum TaxID=3053191 RepID=UPI00287026B9|nr:uncharacterized protein LOC125456777 [Stegostoma tigrinum]
MGYLQLLVCVILSLLDSGHALSHCPALYKLSNGRQFFRYGGIYVIFFCNPGFKRHGFPTSSCVSGRWTRAPPVCVASGCPDIGTILHGSSTLYDSGSIVRFVCDSGFTLLGSRTLYCDGSNWNGTKPICKVTQRAPHSSPITSKSYRWLRRLEGHNIEEDSIMAEKDSEGTRWRASKDRISPNYDLKQPGSFDGTAERITTLATSSKPTLSMDEEGPGSPPLKITQHGTSEYISTRINAAPSPANSIILQYKKEAPNVISDVLLSSDSIPAWSVSGILTLTSPSPWYKSMSAVTVGMAPGLESLHSPTNTPVNLYKTEGGPETTVPPGPQMEITSHSQMAIQIKEELIFTDQTVPRLSTFNLRASANNPNQIEFTNPLRANPVDLDQAKGRPSLRNSLSGSTNGEIARTWANHILQSEGWLANKVTSTPTEVRAPKLSEPDLQNELVDINRVDQNESAHLNLQRPIVCPSPPVPDHGILYFHNLARASPWQYKYYIQYACIPGYRLAHGDQLSFCHNGTWSGETPVCVDINECWEIHNSQPPCEWSCFNIPGSFRCLCPRGYVLNADTYRCEDINECSYKHGGCSHLCINTNGRYRCDCPEGYTFGPYDKKKCQMVRV